MPEPGAVNATWVSLCKGTVLEGPLAIVVGNASTEELQNTPINAGGGCNSGVFTFRVTRDDDGCVAECSWPISSGS